MNLFGWIKRDSLFVPIGVPRSGQWPRVRAEHLLEHPVCEATGATDGLEVHHCVPVHVDPDRELDPANLITLASKALSGFAVHRIIGHAGDWSAWNRNVRRDAAAFYRMLKGAAR